MHAIHAHYVSSTHTKQDFGILYVEDLAVVVVGHSVTVTIQYLKNQLAVGRF